jgi:GNAT superfamily N-acetyltransferase
MVITYLEMHAPPDGAPQQEPEGVAIVRAETPTMSFYRFLYNTVGGPWNWIDRKRLSDEDLAAIIQHSDVAVYVLYLRGVPAGYAELDRRKQQEVQLAYFGLMPEFIGRGLGVFFLDWAVREAWREHPERVWVHTCTSDHPRALPMYQRAGFRPYKEERGVGSHYSAASSSGS